MLGVQKGRAIKYIRDDVEKKNPRKQIDRFCSRLLYLWCEVVERFYRLRSLYLKINVWSDKVRIGHFGVVLSLDGLDERFRGKNVYLDDAHRPTGLTTI